MCTNCGETVGTITYCAVNQLWVHVYRLRFVNSRETSMRRSMFLAGGAGAECCTRAAEWQPGSGANPETGLSFTSSPYTHARSRTASGPEPEILAGSNR